MIKTQTHLVTNTLELLHGNSPLLTTLVTPLVTTVTELSPVTSTLVHPLAPTTTIITNPITYSTIITQTETESYRITFRARHVLCTENLSDFKH